jgi:hypothetical protein
MPLVSSVAAFSLRPKFKLPVTVKIPVPGSYSSALVDWFPLLSIPPAINTIPLFSSVAVCPPARAKFKPPVAVKSPVAGL